MKTALQSIQFLQLPAITDIFLLGFYPPHDFKQFIEDARKRYKPNIRYIFRR